MTNCVYLIPAGGAAPDTTKCDGSAYTAAGHACQQTGAASPQYATIDAKDAFTFTGVCDGSYTLYFGILNSWYVNADPLPIVLSHGQTLPVPVTVTRLGQLSLTMQQIPLNQRSPIALPAKTEIDVSCVGATSTLKQTITTDGSASTAYVIGGLSTGIWTCAGSINPPGSYTTVSTGAQLTSNGQVTATGLVFTQTLGTFFGRVTTSWSGTPTGVSGGEVSVSGTTAFVGGTRVTKTAKVTPNSDGCFAITTDGTIPTGVPVPSACGGSISGSAIGTLALVQNTADFAVSATPAGYVTPPVLTNQAVSQGALVSLSIDPDPVTVSGLTLVSDPAGDFSGFTLRATSQPPGAGTISFAVDTGTGAITLRDSKLAAGQIAPGTYTITATKSGYQDGSVTFTCPAATPTCDLSSTTLTVKKFGSLQIKLGTTADATVALRNGAALVGSPQAASGGVVTFSGLDPDGTYAIDVKAAGYEFGSSDGASPLVALTCSTGGTAIAIPPGGTENCTAALTRDGAISGFVKGVLGTDASTDPTQGLAGIPVTATLGTTTFTTKTLADGSYRITGSATVQGLDGGDWTVSIGGVTGYTPSNGTSEKVSVTSTTADTTAGDLYLYVVPVQVTVRLEDQQKKPVTGATVTLSTNPVMTGTDAGSGNYTFAGVIPGSYVVSYSLAGYSPGSTKIQVLANGQPQTFAASFTQNATLVDGIVQATQGAAQTIKPLLGAVVCVSKTSSDCSAPVAGTDGNALTATTAPDGKFSFSTVPDGNYYIVAVGPYGFTTVSSAKTHIAYPNPTGGVHLTLQPDEVQNRLTVSVATSYDLGSTQATLTNAANPSWTYQLTSSTAKGSGYDYVFNQVPTGCWTFALDALPAYVFGKQVAVSLPTDGTHCTTGQIAVPGIVETAGVDASYKLDVAELKLTLAVKPNASDTAPSLHLKLSDGSKSYVDAAVSAGPVDVWLPSGGSFSAVLTDADTSAAAQNQWPPATLTGITLDPTSATAKTLTITESGEVQVTVTTAGTAAASLTITSTTAALPSVYVSPQTISDASAHDFYLPAGTWTFKATSGSGATAKTDSIDVTVADATIYPATLTPK